MTDRTLNGAIDDAMNTDALGEAEKLVSALEGRDVSYKDGGNLGKLVTGIGFRNMQILSQRKKELAQLSNDTVLCNKLDRYLEIVADLGFKKVLEIEVPEMREDRGDRFFVFVTDDGLILRFDTYNGTSVNASEVYFNYASNDPEARYPSINGGGGGMSAVNIETLEVRKNFAYVGKYSVRKSDEPLVEVDEWRDYVNSDQWTVQYGSVDGREFLRRNVNGLREGRLLSKWAVKPFLWLLHYADTNCPTCFDSDSRCFCEPQFKYDHDAITAARIEAADPALREILENVL